MEKTVYASLDVSVSAGRLRDYVELLKPRVMSLVVFSGLVGLMVAPGGMHPLLGATAILCIAIAAGGSAAVNMWYDRDIDAVMTRTRRRPLPQGRIEPQAALEFGSVLIFAAVVLMALAVNWLAAGLLAVAAAFYIFVYTIWLKRRTSWNIVIGGAAGAFPPLIGWVSVTGRIDLPAVLLFLIIFFWTPPHFWALALYRNDDYRLAGVPMLPVTAGPQRTKIEMLVYTLLLFPLSLSPAFAGIAGPVYLCGMLILSSLFVVCAVRVLFDRTYRSARQMFGYSILYLTLLFSLLLVEAAMRGLS
ncbi:MAG TPA: heme o synthase [Candidatus Sulfotelmatobacter sp.]|jgi:protoheme IX farnesyltransferase|nr:heme o synthase [Candidatus Sulfotelmatobacter sp.]